VIHIVEIVSRTGQLRCVDVVEVNPTIGTSEDVRRTADAARAVIMAACGSARGGVSVPRATQIPKPRRPEQSVVDPSTSESNESQMKGSEF
jgi:hypothetical protein